MWHRRPRLCSCSGSTADGGCATWVLMVYAMMLCIASTVHAQDFSDWQKYRNTIKHPALVIKLADLDRAHANIVRYGWAKAYQKRVVAEANEHLARISPTFLDNMIPQTTPGDSEFTPCPACRTLSKPWHPHGQWIWSIDKPDELKCAVCDTIFPNDQYPESIKLTTHWGEPQTLTFFGGEPMGIFKYEQGRPSFTGSIRSRKVRYMSRAAYALAEAFTLTGDAKYAPAVRDILKRFAQVYPQWLVHVGYGEYADMDPRIAAANIAKLPHDELVYPPNKPDRQLFTGYWSAGRGTGVGRESLLIAPMLQAYDLTCDAIDPSTKQPLYSPDERKQIERDLFLESSILMKADESINNKSVSGRTVAAEIGACLGEPTLVRFGLDSFHRTLSEWFLPDGSTPESPSYAMMSVNGINELPQALRDYSDPPNYTDTNTQRLDHLDLYREPKYAQVWKRMFQTLQGDLTYPTIADTRVGTKFSAPFAELMVAHYPDQPDFVALLKALAGNDLSKSDPATALYMREPGFTAPSDATLNLPDLSLHDLRIGFLRTGPTGRESLLTLSASHWGSHHHLDSLNLTYWRDGHELLSDLGYLWDHPKKPMTFRTLAHNTMLIDEQDQQTDKRDGTMELFVVSSPNVKVMRASSNAYANAKTYRRTSAIIHADTPASYIVDCFEVEGGAKQDFVFHGPNQKFEIADAQVKSTSQSLYDFTNVRTLSKDSHSWRITWMIDDKMEFTAWCIPQPEESAFIADGWGQRDYKNSDIGATLPYIVRRTTGGGPKRFVTVFESHPPGETYIQSVRLDNNNNLLIRTNTGSDCVTLSSFKVTFP